MFFHVFPILYVVRVFCFHEHVLCFQFWILRRAGSLLSQLHRSQVRPSAASFYSLAVPRLASQLLQRPLGSRKKLPQKFSEHKPLCLEQSFGVGRVQVNDLPCLLGAKLPPNIRLPGHDSARHICGGPISGYALAVRGQIANIEYSPSRPRCPKLFVTNSLILKKQYFTSSDPRRDIILLNICHKFQHLC